MTKLVLPSDPPRVKPRQVEELSAEMQAEYDKSVRTWGIPNNLMGTMSCHPQLAMTEVDYANSFIFEEGKYVSIPRPGSGKGTVLFPAAGFVDRVTKELTLSIVSLLNRSRYSITHHSVIATLTLNERVVGATAKERKDRAEAMLLHLVDGAGHVDFENRIYQGAHLYSELQLATLRLAVKLNRDPHSITDAEIAGLRKLQRAEALRQIESSALASQFSNGGPDAAYLDAYVDAMLVEFTWCTCHFSGLLNRWFTTLHVRDEEFKVDGTHTFVDNYNAVVPDRIKQRNNELLGSGGWGNQTNGHAGTTIAHSPLPLEKYDHRRCGPLLGVSDEGDAAPTIAEAAYLSAKALAAPDPCPLAVGMIIDGERMTSAGEVPIGPDEYAKVTAAGVGRTFCSTNVGTRVSTRLHEPLPDFAVKDAIDKEEQWLDSIFAVFAKFIHTPDGKPRPLTVRLLLESTACSSVLRKLVPKLEAGRAKGKIGPKDLHRLSILLVFSQEIKENLQPIRDILQVAADLKVPEVAVDGQLREAARRRLSIQGLLNVLEPQAANSLLGEASKLKVRLTYRFEDDPESASRIVWTGMQSAKANGLNAAKYGLTPLVLDQQREVVRHVQHWMRGWTSVPAFYVDTPLVTHDRVYQSDECLTAAKLWMDMVSQEGAKIILVDSPDRIVPRKLLKAGPNDSVGVLTIKQLAELNAYAERRNLRVLWSGGIRADQAFELGRLGVFGLFTTGSTARQVPVTGVLAKDAALASMEQPTSGGVRRIHALVQAGFLCNALAKETALVRSIEKRVKPVLADDLTSNELDRHLRELNAELVRGWKKHWHLAP
jgi:hypothetical protein